MAKVNPYTLFDALKKLRAFRKRVGDDAIPVYYRRTGANPLFGGKLNELLATLREGPPNALFTVSTGDGIVDAPVTGVAFGLVVAVCLGDDPQTTQAATTPGVFIAYRAD